MKYILMSILLFASTAQAQKSTGVGDVGRTTQGLTVLTVGDDVSCDFNTLENALDAVPADALDGDYEIRVADTLVTEPVVINKSVEITGGLLICDGNPVPGRRLEIDGDNFTPGTFGSGLRISAINTSHVVRLNNVDIKNHESSLGGGISAQTVTAAGNIELHLKSVSLLGNTAVNAGVGGWVDDARAWFEEAGDAICIRSQQPGITRCRYFLRRRR